MTEADFLPGGVEGQARAWLRRMLPAAWLVEALVDRPPLDVSVVLTADGEPVGVRFAVLLHEADALERREGAVIVPGLEVQALEEAAGYPDPVLLLAYDREQAAGYWLWLKPWLEAARDEGWEALSTVEVAIPEDNAFDADAVRRIVADLGADEHVLERWPPAEGQPEEEAEEAWEAAEEAEAPAEVLEQPSAAWPEPEAGEVAVPVEEAEAEGPYAEGVTLPESELPPVEVVAEEEAEGPGEQAAVEEAVAEEPAPPAEEEAAEPLEIDFKLHAPLPVVEAAHYLRYGRAGARRYGTQPEEAVPEPGTAEPLPVTLSWQDAEGAELLTIPHVPLHQAQVEEDSVVWMGQDLSYGLQLAWVWDFYRMLSFVYMKIRLSPSPTAEQAALKEALLALSADDVLLLRADLPAGGLEQRHVVTPELLAERDSRLSEPGQQD